MSENTVMNAVGLLGLEATDKVTNFKGIITTVCFDLYGCCQVVLTPQVSKDGKKEEGHWMDSNRLQFETKPKRVMPAPAFAQAIRSSQVPGAVDHGPAEKPRGHRGE